MADFPEPRTFNGDPDETGGYIGRSTGPRREPAVDDLRRCDHCTVVLHWTDRGGRGPIRIVCLGEFCSDRCANEASEQHARALQPATPTFHGSRSER